MPVATVATRASAPAAESTHDTPAELPSGRASFQDALGRETALDRGRAASTSSARDRSGPSARPASQAANAKSKKPAERPLEPESAPDAEVDEEALAALLPLLAAATPDTPSLDAAANLELAGGVGGVAAVAELGTPAPSAAASDAVAALGFSDPGGAPVAGTAAQASSAAPLAGETLVHATTASKGGAPDAEALPAASAPAAAATDAALPAHLARAAAPLAEPTRAPAPSLDGALAQPDRSAVAADRMVTLAELPRALQSEVDGFLRVRGHGRHWEAELRLDPPELGALHVRLEMRGHTLHGVVRVEDAQLEPTLERFLKDLEQDLRKQGGAASFDLSRGTREGGGDGAWSPPAAARARSAGGDAPLPVRERGTGPDADRLVDLLA